MFGSFEESAHPRNHGKFTLKSGGQSASGALKSWAGNKQLELPGTSKPLSAHERHTGLSGNWRLFALKKASTDPALAAELKGKLDKGVTEQRKIARDVVASHKAALPGHLDALKKLAPEGALVQGRAKSINSTAEKVARKPKYGDPTKEGDVTGLRVVTDDLKGVRDTVDKIKQRFATHEDDDKITNPQGFYRSHHLGVTGDHGGAMEVQVRTKRQHILANEVHDIIYKPGSPEEKKWVDDHKKEIEDHYKKLSDYGLELDKGRPVHEVGEPPAHPEWMKGKLPDIGEHMKDPSHYNFNAGHGYLLDEQHGHMDHKQSAPSASPAPSPTPTTPHENLKEDHPRYFKMDADTKDIPLDKITPIRAREKGIANAHKYMKGAYEGTHEKRDPISLEDQGDGSYKVMDGNSTFANAQKNGWKGIAAKVWAKGQWKDPKAGKH